MSDNQKNEVTLDDYKEILHKANVNVSKDPKLAFNKLISCLEIFDSLDSIPKNREFDKLILIDRISYMEKAFGFESDLDLNTLRKDERKRIKDQISTHSQQTKTTIIEEEGVIGREETALEKESGESGVSMAESLISEKEEPLALGEIPQIISDVYQKLKNHEDPAYDEYLKFYQEVNNIVPFSLGAIIEQESPMTYFIGDTHGSYEEALVMITYFEKIIEEKPQVKIVFVGDYVDRNPRDLENLTLITGFYLTYPKNVVLLRGNHEDEMINKQYGFMRNLMDNFVIPERAENIYSEILKFFTHLPVGLVNKLIKDGEPSIRVFSAHGGIPVNMDNPNEPVNLNLVKDEINLSAKSYDEFDPYMSWLLWADPKEEIEGAHTDSMTGRSQFGKDVFDRFLNENDLQYMVRAHEKWPDGYKFFFNDQLVSLFSTSVYSKKKIGEAAFIRLEPGMPPKILRPKENLLNEDLNNF